MWPGCRGRSSSQLVADCPIPVVRGQATIASVEVIGVFQRSLAIQIGNQMSATEKTVVNPSDGRAC